MDRNDNKFQIHLFLCSVLEAKSLVLTHVPIPRSGECSNLASNNWTMTKYGCSHIQLGNNYLSSVNLPILYRYFLLGLIISRYIHIRMIMLLVYFMSIVIQSESDLQWELIPVLLPLICILIFISRFNYDPCSCIMIWTDLNPETALLSSFHHSFIRLPTNTPTNTRVVYL